MKYIHKVVEEINWKLVESLAIAFTTFHSKHLEITVVSGRSKIKFEYSNKNIHTV